MADVTWRPITVHLSALVPWDRNPKTISKTHAARLLDLWQRLGQFQTIAIGPGGEVYDGHQRLSVLKAAHGAQFEVTALQSDRALTEKEREELTVAAHVGTTGQFNWDELSGWDADELQTWGFDAETLKDWNTGATALATMLESAQDAPPDDPGPQIDRADELREKWQTAPGQLWQLGEHRLICGDCTDAAVVARVMGGERAVLLCTDPPYGVDFEGAKYNPRAKKWAGIEGDKRQGDDLTMWLANCLRTWLEHCTDDLAVYLWTAAMQEGAAAAAAAAAGIHIQSQIIWNKNTLVLGQADYQWKHENCWYGFLKGKHHRWFGGRAQTTVWNIDKIANSSYLHPMQKPAELYEIAIRNHTLEGDICAEPFCGSGTQIVACERLNRRCRGVEISPAYCAVAIQRWADMTGQEPVLLEPAITG